MRWASCHGRQCGPCGGAARVRRTRASRARRRGGSRGPREQLVRAAGLRLRLARRVRRRSGARSGARRPRRLVVELPGAQRQRRAAGLHDEAVPRVQRRLELLRRGRTAAHPGPQRERHVRRQQRRRQREPRLRAQLRQRLPSVRELHVGAPDVEAQGPLQRRLHRVPRQAPRRRSGGAAGVRDVARRLDARREHQPGPHARQRQLARLRRDRSHGVVDERWQEPARLERHLGRAGRHQRLQRMAPEWERRVRSVRSRRRPVRRRGEQQRRLRDDGVAQLRPSLLAHLRLPVGEHGQQHDRSDDVLHRRREDGRAPPWRSAERLQERHVPHDQPGARRNAGRSDSDHRLGRRAPRRRLHPLVPDGPVRCVRPRRERRRGDGRERRRGIGRRSRQRRGGNGGRGQRERRARAARRGQRAAGKRAARVAGAGRARREARRERLGARRVRAVPRRSARANPTRRRATTETRATDTRRARRARARAGWR